MTFNSRFYFNVRNQIISFTFSSSMCAFRIVVSLRMTYPGSKHVVLSDTQILLSKYCCVLTDKNFVHCIIVTQSSVTHKEILFPLTSWSLAITTFTVRIPEKKFNFVHILLLCVSCDCYNTLLYRIYRF
jgi:hypothetical protein